MKQMTPIVPKVILDTSIIIDYLHDIPKAVVLINQLSQKLVIPCVSVITYMELGIGFTSTSQKTKSDKFLSKCDLYSLTPAIARYGIELLQIFGNDSSQKKHMTSDAIIAATAEDIGADIYTNNLKHFRLFSLKKSNIFGYEYKNNKP